MNRQRGFTLIEIVVAFVLLALVLGTSFQIFSQGLARTHILEERSQALLIAQSQLNSAGGEQQLAEGQSAGQSADGRYQWVTSVARTNEGNESGGPAPSAYALYRIDVVVSWLGSDGRAQSLPLSTLQVWKAPS
ncbi:MAG TPA: prepilin-type N-terminal cleavage/methylation domain-containing protein [Usitatibacter sp.]|nr:prepilin-type N-terminal cleavage/methylation domain-containing protein [Usitatibacter sp.]